MVTYCKVLLAHLAVRRLIIKNEDDYAFVLGKVAGSLWLSRLMFLLLRNLNRNQKKNKSTYK